ncbi:lysoplasmalogenase [Cellulomonas sp. HZM]|uniref:lysoplasmalogenase n=1 Tax=Cellulomonas sp. HZM TaxID=1454010 RepID=UPI0006913092|nr:lysoplasmalogenase [Cellulomonas sp. HZM]
MTSTNRAPVAAARWGACFAVVALVHLGALLAGADGLADLTQVLLLPPLAAALWSATAAPRSHRVRWTLAALVASWLGDSLPRLVTGDAAFLVMVGCFLVAQAAFVVGFAPDVRRSVVHRRPLLVLPYAAVLVTLVGACAPAAGPLLVPVAVYGGVLVAMAVLATGCGPLVAAGGAVFLVSDGLIALDRFVDAWHPPVPGFWVMATYVAAQSLIALGVARADLRARRGVHAGRDDLVVA